MRGFRGRAGSEEGAGAPARAPSATSRDPSGSAQRPEPDAQDPVTVVIDRSRAGGSPPARADDTRVLDAQVAASLADPGASTEVLPRGPVIGSGAVAGGATPGPLAGPSPVVSRRVAAEIGMYTGAGLVLVSIGGVVVRGWGGWGPELRGAFAGLTTVALVAAGLFVRLPWSRAVSGERRRAVSALLSAGVAVATGVGVAVGSAQDAMSAGTGNAVRALGVVLAMVAVNVVARTPVSESGLLAAGAWAAWVVVPPGPGTWAFLVGLGVAWAVLGRRWAHGRRTSMVLGAALALAASVGMATGPWAWPTRAGLAAVVVLGLGAFLRGRENYWLALGAGAATALAASVAGDVVGPALALLVGGLATMVVSWVALRSARRG